MGIIVFFGTCILVIVVGTIVVVLSLNHHFKNSAFWQKNLGAKKSKSSDEAGHNQ